MSWMGTSPLSNSCRGARICGRRQGPSDGTSPHSIGGRVAFPTLRPPRLRLSRGPAPWTKRGKRTTVIVRVEVAVADFVRRGLVHGADGAGERFPRAVQGRDPQTAKRRWAGGGKRWTGQVDNLPFAAIPTSAHGRANTVVFSRHWEDRPFQSRDRVAGPDTTAAMGMPELSGRRRRSEHRPLQKGAGSRCLPLRHFVRYLTRSAVRKVQVSSRTGH